VIEFSAFQIREEADGTFSRHLVRRTTDELPAGDVLIRVAFSALNYKDALSASGHKGITRKFPHTPGIDAAGLVVESAVPEFQPGQRVLVTSFDMGMNTSGGFAEYIRVPAGWVVPLPDSLSLSESMILGTGGLTAALALWKLERNGLQPDHGPVLVTGASGGVGSVAVALLHKAGYQVIAASGKPSAHDLLRELGATEIVDRASVDDQSGKALLPVRWAAAIDTVGGNMLSTAIKACRPEGSVAVIGLVADNKFTTTVYPFLIRGVNVVGIETGTTDIALRRELWNRLATTWRLPDLAALVSYIELSQLSDYIDLILKGETQGRVVLKLATVE
jgi:acrylyl-CoA reductase (NADPH)